MCIVGLVLVLSLAPVVSGDLTEEEREIRLVPMADWEYNETANLGEKEGLQLEQDLLASRMMETEGIYYGPYVRSSLFRFEHQGGTFEFWGDFRWTHQEIINGVSDFWLRVPVDPFQYEQWEIEIQDLEMPYVGIAPTQEDRPYTIVVDYKWRCLDYYQHEGRCVDPKVDDPHVQMDELGIYIRFWTGLFPDVTYRFRFEGDLFPEIAPLMWLSMERLQVDTETTFRFFDLPLGSEVYNYNITNHLEVYPAWAFNFASGMGQSGLTSFRLPAKNSTSFYRYVTLFHLVDDSSMDQNYVSIYLPFDSWDGPVDFHINVTCARGYWQFEDPVTPANKANYQDWWVYGVEEFLLTTTPWRLDHKGVGDPNYPNLEVLVSYSKDVTFLGYVTRGMDSEDWIAGGDIPWYIPFYNSTLWQTTFYPARVVPIFIQVHVTDGQWAQVTHLDHYKRFDFGWGRAYLYKGETTLVMFLNNGTSYYGTGDDPFAQDYCKVPSEWFDVPSWLHYLICIISNLGGDLVGWLSSLFDRIWSTLVGFGEWLYSSAMAFYGWLVTVVMNIVDVVGTILQSSLMILPMLLAIFVLAKGGRYIANIGAEKTDKETVREALGRASGRVTKAWKRGKSWRETTGKRLKFLRRGPR